MFNPLTGVDSNGKLVIGIKFLSEQIAEPLAITGKGRQNIPTKICS